MKTALLALLLLSLTACQAFPPGSGSGDGSEAARGAGSDGGAGGVSGPESPDQDQAERARKRRAPPPKPPQPPQRVELDEQRLTGLTTKQTWDVLGPPSEVEEQAPATVWTYEASGCRLELFFYFDLESQEQRTLALDLEAASDFVGSRPFCWYTLAKRGRSRQAPMPQADAARDMREDARVSTAQDTRGDAHVPAAQEADGQAGAPNAPEGVNAGTPAEADGAAADPGLNGNAPPKGETAQ